MNIMKIKQLTIENFRGIKNLTYNFNDHINLLIGENGAGKSTTLDALVIALSNFFSYYMPKTKGQSISDYDVRNGEHYTTIRVNAEIDNKPVWWSINKIEKEHPKNVKGGFYQKVSWGIDTRRDFKDYDFTNIVIPAIVYYPVNRVVDDITKDNKINLSNKKDPISNFGDIISFKRKIDFNDLFNWYKSKEDLENERKLDYYEYNRSHNLYYDQQLNAVRTAIQIFTGFSDLHVRRDSLRWELTKGNEKLYLDQLSDGEKGLLSLVGDLTRRLAIANPDLTDPFKGAGLVLIDEIELHLHPRWQRKVIEDLKKTFPNCQFIITTHSPSVISHVTSDELFVLKQQNSEGVVCYKPDYQTFGKSTNRILEDIMSVSSRPEEIDEELNVIYYLINNNDVKTAKDKIEKLKNRVGDDPDILKAEVFIDRMKGINK